MKFWDIIIGSLTSGNDISEKRVTRMVVIVVCLLLTIIEFCVHNFTIRVEIFLAWMGLAGYDGFRITQEKRQQVTETAKVDAAKEVTKQVEAMKEDTNK